MRKVKNMNAKLLKVSAVLAASLLAVGLAACSASGGGDERPAGTSDAAALIETQPSGADEAAKLYAQLMQKENEDKGYALYNICMRMKLYYGKDSTLELKNNDPVGTVCTLRLSAMINEIIQD